MRLHELTFRHLNCRAAVTAQADGRVVEGVIHAIAFADDVVGLILDDGHGPARYDFHPNDAVEILATVPQRHLTLVATIN